MKDNQTSNAVALLYNDAAEQTILGTAISYGGMYVETMLQSLSAMMFYQPQHKAVFNIIADLDAKGMKVDFSSVGVEYAKTSEGSANPSYITSLLDSASTSTFKRSLQEVVEKNKCRRIREICLKYSDTKAMTERSADEIAQALTEEIKQLGDNPNTSITSFADALDEVKEAIKGNQEGKGNKGLLTGFRHIDERGGFFPSDLVVVAAESSQGKTSFAMDIAVNIAKDGVPVAVYTMEMRKAQLSTRVLAQETNINSRLIMGERLNSEEVERINETIARLRNLPVYFDESSTTSINTIYFSIRTLARRMGVKMVVVDYLQILSTNQKVVNLEAFYGEVTRWLKNLAKDLNICIVLLSQLSRGYDTAEPSLSRLRGSGQINEAADMTFLIYRPEYYGKHYTGEFAMTDPKGTALIECAKGRNVGTYSFVCGFDAEHTHFYDIENLPRLNLEEL